MVWCAHGYQPTHHRVPHPGRRTDPRHRGRRRWGDPGRSGRGGCGCAGRGCLRSPSDPEADQADGLGWGSGGSWPASADGGEVVRRPSPAVPSQHLSCVVRHSGCFVRLPTDGPWADNLEVSRVMLRSGWFGPDRSLDRPGSGSRSVERGTEGEDPSTRGDLPVATGGRVGGHPHDRGGGTPDCRSVELGIPEGKDAAV